jgi:hypothetical protein
MPRTTVTCLMLTVLIASCGAKPPSPAVGQGETNPPADTSWGEPVDGLQLGLFFHRRSFRAGEEITASVRAKNDGESPIVLYNFDHEWYHLLTLTNMEDSTCWLGGAGLFIDVDRPQTVTLAPGQLWERTAVLNDGERRFLRIIENRKPGDDWDYRDSLPGGRYRVAIEFHSGNKDSRFYQGTPRTNEVEILIED